MKFMEAEKRLKLERYRRLNQLAQKGAILLVGSSLMEQFPIHELMQDDGSCAAVYNRGIGAYTTTELRHSMDDLIFDLEPSVIFINIGTNDLSIPGCTINTLIANYRDILVQIQTRLPRTEVYVMAYYPVNDRIVSPDWKDAARMIASRKEKLPSANHALELLASEMGYTFLDLNEGLTDEDGLLRKEFTSDGIHIYANGYQVVYQNMRQYLGDRK